VDSFTGSENRGNDAGEVVVTAGEVLVISRDDWPRLHGYFVCPSLDALYGLLSDPR
jgi:hypothetical protein